MDSKKQKNGPREIRLGTLSWYIHCKESTI